MAIPTRKTIEIHRNEELSSWLLFGTSDDLTDSAHVEAARVDSSNGILQHFPCLFVHSLHLTLSF